MADFDPTQFGAVAVEEQPEPFDPTKHGAIPVQEEAGIPTKIGRAVLDTVKGFLPQSVEEAALAPITAVPGIGKVGRILSNIAFGKPIAEDLSPIGGIPVVQRIPQIAQAEKTAPYSQERFTAGIGTLADVAMLAGFKSLLKPKLSEVAGIKPEVAPEAALAEAATEPIAAPSQPVPEPPSPTTTEPFPSILRSAEEQRRTEQNAIQEPIATQPDGVRAEPQVPEETAQPPASIGGEGIPEVGQGAEVSGGAGQEVAPLAETGSGPVSEPHSQVDDLIRRAASGDTDANFELRDLVRPPQDANPQQLETARNALRKIFPDVAGGKRPEPGDDFSRGIYDFIHGRNETPRVYFTDFTKRISAAASALPETAGQAAPDVQALESDTGTQPVSKIETTTEAPKESSIQAQETPAVSTPEATATSEPTGIAERYRESEQPGSVIPGAGVTSEQARTYGHDFINKGGDPYMSVRRAQAGNTSWRDVGVARAEYERLGNAKRAAEDALEADPNNPQLQEAFNTADEVQRKWSKDAQPILTRAGDALRAATRSYPREINSFSDFTDIVNEHYNGNVELTPKIRADLQKAVKGIKTANMEANAARTQVTEAVVKKAGGKFMPFDELKADLNSTVEKLLEDCVI